METPPGWVKCFWTIVMKHSICILKSTLRLTLPRSSPLALYLQLGFQHFLCFIFKSIVLFDIAQSITLTPLLTFRLVPDPRWTPWRRWGRRSVGWHAVRTTPSTPTSPSLLVRFNTSVRFKLTISFCCFMLFKPHSLVLRFDIRGNTSSSEVTD